MRDLTNHQWERLHPIWSLQKLKVGRPNEAARSIVKASCGLSVQEHLGETCQQDMVVGQLLLVAFSDGEKQVSGSAFCQRCNSKDNHNRLKQFRRLATRYEKRAENYLAMLMIHPLSFGYSLQTRPKLLRIT